MLWFPNAPAYLIYLSLYAKPLDHQIINYIYDPNHKLHKLCSTFMLTAFRQWAVHQADAIRRCNRETGGRRLRLSASFRGFQRWLATRPLKNCDLSLQKLMSGVDRNDMLASFHDTTVALYDFVASSIDMLKVVQF